MVTKIDIFALGPSPYDEVEFSRRRKVKVRASGEELFVGVNLRLRAAPLSYRGGRSAPLPNLPDERGQSRDSQATGRGRLFLARGPKGRGLVPPPSVGYLRFQ